MYGEIFGRSYLPCLQWIEALFILTIPAFEGLHDDI